MASGDTYKVQPIAYYRKNRTSVKAIARNKSAAETIGAITHGSGFSAITAGQWDMIAAIKHCLSQIGPAHVWLSTWVPAMQEIADLKDLKESGTIKSLTLMIDTGFQNCRRIHAETTLEWLGAENIIVARNHSKIVLMKNESYAYVLRGSLNLNANNRCENVDGDESKEMFDAWLPFFTEYKSAIGFGMNKKAQDVYRAHCEVMGVKNQGKPAEIDEDMLELDSFLEGL
jgi:hypothetical protein